jgi:hypothetical protein
MRALSGGINPITLWTFVVSRLSSKFISGRIVGIIPANNTFNRNLRLPNMAASNGL